MELMQLRGFAVSALSFSSGVDVDIWERNAVRVFDAFLGGRDIFKAVESFGGAYVLATTVERSSVRLQIYGGGRVYPDALSVERVRYAVTGRGLFAHFKQGECHEVREEIERGYQTALDILGADAFQTSFDKALPYSSEDDPGLLDVHQGVVECIIPPYGDMKNPLRLDMPRPGRLQVGAYHDLRLYDDVEELVDGMRRAWRGLVSPFDKDWDSFFVFARPVLDAMTD